MLFSIAYDVISPLLIGRPDLDATSTATTRDDLNVKTVILE